MKAYTRNKQGCFTTKQNLFALKLQSLISELEDLHREVILAFREEQNIMADDVHMPSAIRICNSFKDIRTQMLITKTQVEGYKHG